MMSFNVVLLSTSVDTHQR